MTEKHWDFSLLLIASAIVLISGLYAGLSVGATHPSQAASLDIDGWGHLIGRLKTSEGSFPLLLQAPSLWKGPIVPFFFGLSYYLVPSDWSVLFFNVGAFALAAGVFFVGFTLLGVSRILAASVIFLWLVYLHTHRYVFGYYYAEPLLSLLTAVLFLLVGRLILRFSPFTAFVGGGLAGLLILARAPFLLSIVGVLIILWFRLASKRQMGVTLFCVGLVIVWMPWVLRNYMLYEAVIPFTTEGGKILFQGTYLKGDSDLINNIRQILEFQQLEEGEKGKSEVEIYRYWQGLARQQIVENPIGQVRLCLRKALRFWVYLPSHSWIPSWKTAIVALSSLLLALVGAVYSRHRILVQLCIVWVGGLWLFHALVHAELRYNFPVLPMLLVLALEGLRCLFTSYSRDNGYSLTSLPRF